MSEPRYPTRVGDPDETTRIPKDALGELRAADQGPAGSSAAPAGSGSGPASGGSADVRTGPNGSGVSGPPGPSGPAGTGPPGAAPAGSGVGSPLPSQRTGGGSPAAAAAPRGDGMNGFPSDGAPGFPSDGAPGFPSDGAPGPGLSAPRRPDYGGANGAAGSGSPGVYTGRSETGYSPSAYPSAYAPGYPSPGDAPTTVTGGPAGAGSLAAGSVGRGSVGAGSTAAARSALGAAGRPSGRGATTSTRPARRARLLVRHIDPWSTLKFSFVLSIAMFFVWLVAVGVLYGVLDGMGVFDQINGLYGEVSGNGGDTLFSPGLVLGSATLIGAVNIVLFTALATIGAFVYNICSDLVGGIEITLAERD